MRSYLNIVVLCGGLLSVSTAQAQEKNESNAGEQAVAADKSSSEGSSAPQKKAGKKADRSVPKKKAEAKEGKKADGMQRKPRSGAKTTTPTPADKTAKGKITKTRTRPTKAVVKPETVNTDKRAQIDRRAPGIHGATGLDRVFSAHTGPLHTIRGKLSLGVFSASDFPADGGENTFIGSYFSFGYTPHKYAEVFGSVSATSNSNDSEQPALLQTQGDLTLGAKGAYPVTPLVTVGAALSARFLSGLGSSGFSAGATSYDLRLLSSFDLLKTQQLPLRIHVELGNYFENSAAVADDLYGEPSVVQEFGLQVARYDRLNFGLGIESPFHDNFTPFLEYQISKPHFVQLDRTGPGSSEYSFASIPHHVTLGLRSFPIEHLALDAAVRIGLSDSPHTGVPATPPYLVVLGAAYTLDPAPKVVTRTVERRIEAPKPKPVVMPTATVSGLVVDKKTGRPIADARIRYPESEFTAQVTGQDGRFAGYQFKPGKMNAVVEARGYTGQSVAVNVAKSGTTSVRVELVPDPAQQRGRLRITVVNDRKKAIAADIALGARDKQIKGSAKPKAPFTTEYDGGRHPIEVSARGYDTLRTMVVVRGGDTAELRYTLAKAGRQDKAVPRRAPKGTLAPDDSQKAGGRLASVSRRAVVARKRISFEPGTSDLTGDSKAVLNDIARGLRKISSIKRVRIGVHVSGTGSRERDSRLSIARANRVKAYLVGRGVAANRLQARGYGGMNPVRPSLTARARAQNERVVFKVLGK